MQPTPNKENPERRNAQGQRSGSCRPFPGARPSTLKTYHAQRESARKKRKAETHGQS